MMDLTGFRNKTVRIFQSDGFTIVGQITSSDSDFVYIVDKYKKRVLIRVNDISKIEECQLWGRKA